MRIATQITLNPISESTEEQPPTSELVLNGVPTGRRIHGAILEAAVEWNSLYLVFLTDDIPHEEMLRIVLLDEELNVLDTALIGAPYSSGSFSSLELREPDTVKFHFIGGSPWLVQLRGSKGLRLPFVSEPQGVYRPFGFSRQFIVRKTPSPEV